jgi:tetratricopeptide (TPR) repeat protein
MGDGDLTQKGKWIFKATSLALILALVLWGCAKPKETPLERAERLLAKNDAASLKEAKVALQEALAANPQAARVHFLLGTTYRREAEGEQNRNKSEEIYGNATTELEKALELHGQSGAPVEVYQQLVDVCRERALVPKRFNAEEDVRVGVGPWEVKSMEKAIKTFEQGRARFPNDPAFAGEKVKALQEELATLKALYTKNVYKAWASRPAGYMSPEEYQEQQKRYH